MPPTLTIFDLTSLAAGKYSRLTMAMDPHEIGALGLELEAGL